MKTTKRFSAFASALILAVLPGLAGCASESGDKPADTKPGAAQIWAENCSRCHNARSPSTYSDAQWEVIGHHMRVRGYLTGEEQRTIVEFLKAGN